MAVTAVDLTAVVGGYTKATPSVDTDGARITAPSTASALYVRATVAGTWSSGGGDDVPLDANAWTLAWQRSPALSSNPVVLVKPSSGTATVYAVVV